MNCAADFRKFARDALRGNWRVAVLTGFVASLIGANIATEGGRNFDNNNSTNNIPENLQVSEFYEALYPILLTVFVTMAIWAVVTLVIGGAGKLGYAKFNLNVINRKPFSLSDLFSQFHRLGTGFCMNLLMSLYTILWSLLFVIPGIVKSYSYSMTPYILAEHPEMTVNEAITQSRQIMHGNKWRLFCLQFSFIGWELLCIVPPLVLLPLFSMEGYSRIVFIILLSTTLFVWNLFLTPYKETAQAAFYRDVTYINPTTASPVTPNNTNFNC